MKPLIILTASPNAGKPKPTTINSMDHSHAVISNREFLLKRSPDFLHHS